MNLSELFEEESKESNQVDIEKELILIFNKHGIKNPNEKLISELALIYTDTPPWLPWTK